MEKSLLLAFMFFMVVTHRSGAQAETNKTLIAQATFAGGCFWCMEPSFEKLEGVVDVTAGYTGGKKANPTYEEVSSATTGHREAVEITYDPTKITYQKLLDTFWRQIDPTDSGGQFSDRGPQYRTAIYYYNVSQKKEAEESKRKLASSGKFKKAIVTEILEAGPFFSAEKYHQNYYQTNAEHYNQYKYLSGREAFIKKTWPDDSGLNVSESAAPTCNTPSPQEIKRKLTPLQYEVTQNAATEKPFNNAYWDNKKEGIYVDIISGEVLFSSKDKFDSGTGWPSFTRPLEEQNIVQEEDDSLGVSRTEVRSKNAGSHLGHLFDDGPSETGQRYCINSAALRFISREDLDKEGYGQYKSLFE